MTTTVDYARIVDALRHENQAEVQRLASGLPIDDRCFMEAVSAICLAPSGAFALSSFAGLNLPLAMAPRGPLFLKFQNVYLDSVCRYSLDDLRWLEERVAFKLRIDFPELVVDEALGRFAVTLEQSADAVDDPWADYGKTALALLLLLRFMRLNLELHDVPTAMSFFDAIDRRMDLRRHTAEVLRVSGVASAQEACGLAPMPVRLSAAAGSDSEAAPPGGGAPPDFERQKPSLASRVILGVISVVVLLGGMWLVRSCQQEERLAQERVRVNAIETHRAGYIDEHYYGPKRYAWFDEGEPEKPVLFFRAADRAVSAVVFSPSVFDRLQALGKLPRYGDSILVRSHDAVPLYREDLYVVFRLNRLRDIALYDASGSLTEFKD